MMESIFIKVNSIKGIQHHKHNHYIIRVNLSETPDYSQESVLIFENEFLTNSIFSLPYSNATGKNMINIAILNQNKKEEVLCRVSLPLQWFPHNFVVHETYPMNPKEFNIEMDVHICKNENEAFRAPNGNLLVIPAWKPIPQQSQQQQPRTQMQQNPSILLGIPKILYGPVPQTFTQSITQTFARPLPQVTQQQLRYYNPY